MFWKESLFISVLFHYYDFFSNVFFLFISNYWLDLRFIFQFVPFGFLFLTYFVLFSVASHGRGRGIPLQRAFAAEGVHSAVSNTANMSQ